MLKQQPNLGQENPATTLRVRLLRAARILAIVYLGILLLMMIFEEKLIFLPDAGASSDWNPRGLEFEDAHFRSADGTKLHGWYVPHPSPRAIVLYAHGNAGNLTTRASLLKRLKKLNVSVSFSTIVATEKVKASPTRRAFWPMPVRPELG